MTLLTLETHMDLHTMTCFQLSPRVDYYYSYTVNIDFQVLHTDILPKNRNASSGERGHSWDYKPYKTLKLSPLINLL